ncbi:Integrin beta-nu [Eumeta japonica]|uniref:Integrin beta n=1 Tax=Eumeta variegata TaxID=151549 RepID=A0A4C1VNC8_EUMVA|nr:Integrin beta-nu [Eumeta japonica]
MRINAKCMATPPPLKSMQLDGVESVTRKSFEFTITEVQQQLLKKLACIEQESCGACLAAGPHCRWCADPYFSSAAPRCNDEESLVSSDCSQEHIQMPEPPVWEVAENRSLQDMTSDAYEAVVQIQPQKINLSLKPRETKKIKFSYRPAKNYPLDLYYLMDLTWSMKDDKETLVSLRDDLPEMLRNLTDNFRLGFGSFAEKPLMPYTSMDARRKANPCAAEGEACESTYSFKHHLSLTSEVNEFIEKVNKSVVTANLDNAEAQLEALMQVVACGARLGWSQRSRKIVILLSDGLMHTAGDGKLGGAVLRNDETCHLDENGYYSEADVYDYPSIAQIYRLLDKHKVNVIFAVTENVKQHYDNLHKVLDEFTYVAKLESDSSNILKLVKRGYEDIVSVVNFEDDSGAGPINVKYFSDCGVEDGPMRETTKCSGVEYGMTLNYEAHIRLDKCVEYKNMQQILKITESQLGQDALTLDIKVHCGCKCDDGQRARDFAEACPTHSGLICGVCQCDQGWSGPTCNCSTSDEAAWAALTSECRQPNTTTQPCSGVGDCVCGKCACDRGYNGKFCQCKSCANSKDNGLECGGVGRGTCVCGRCDCAPGWTGETCDCTDSIDTCIAPGDSERTCSGYGSCQCGKCVCNASEEGSLHTGRYCETCRDCDNPLCAHAEPCVLCHLEKNCTQFCSSTNINYTVTEGYNETVRYFDVKDDLRYVRPVTDKADAILEKVEQEQHISSY